MTFCMELWENKVKKVSIFLVLLQGEQDSIWEASALEPLESRTL